MAWQAIFTSLPEGIVDGQSGFCLAARNEEMPGHLVRALEHLSAYTHFAAPDSDEAAINPVIAAHRILEFSEGRFHVLSRIRSAGMDFARRSNHIAHHLVFAEDEIGSLPSPAHILRVWSGWRDAWREPPRLLDSRDEAEFTALRPALSLPAKTWRAATGREEYAFLLLNEQVRECDGCYVLAALLPGTHQPLRGEELLLRLFEESLLFEENPEDRWRTSFTTFLQSTDNPADFVWRGWRKEVPLPADVESTGVYVFDLTDPSSLPPLEVAEPAVAAEEPSDPPVVVEAARPAVVEEAPVQTPADERSPKGGSARPQQRDSSEGLPPVLAEALADYERARRDREKTAKNLPPVISERIAPPSAARGKKPPPRRAPAFEPEANHWLGPKFLLVAISVLVVMIAAATSGIRWFRQAAPAPEPPPVVVPEKPSPSGSQKPAKTPTLSPPVMSEREAPQPVYLVMDGDDINKILEEHLGGSLTKDTLDARCELSANEARGALPPLFAPQSKVTVMRDTGNVYGADNTLLFRFVSRLSSLNIHAARTTSHWFIQFRPRTETVLPDGSKPRSCTILLWVRNQPPPFRWGTDCLTLEKGCLAVGDSTHRRLDLLRLRAGKVRLMTRLAMPGSQPPQTVVMESPALDVSSLDYEELLIDVTPATRQYDKPLTALKTRKADLERQFNEPGNIVKNAQQWLLNEPDLNTAWKQVFESVPVNTHATSFSDYWARSLSRSGQGKDLPDLGDYCVYLVNICGGYVRHRLGRSPTNSEMMRIAGLMKDPAKNSWDIRKVPDVPDGLESIFLNEFRTSPVRSYFAKALPNPNFGKRDPRGFVDQRQEIIRTDIRYSDAFKAKWQEIFTPERINALQNLTPPRDLGDYRKQVEDLDKEEQRLEELKHRLPKTARDFGVVWLMWETVENGTTQSIPLVEFGASSETATAADTSAGTVSAVAPAQAQSAPPPSEAVPATPSSGTLRSTVFVAQEGQDIKPVLMRGFTGQIAQNNLNHLYELRVLALTNGWPIRTAAASPAVYMPENGAIYEQDRAVLAIEKGSGIVPRIREKQAHWLLSFSPLNSNLLASDFLLLVSKQPPLPPPVVLTTRDLKFIGRRVSLGSGAVAQLKPLQPVSGLVRFVTTVQKTQWCSPDGEVVIKTPGVSIDYAKLGLDFGHLEKLCDRDCAKEEKAKAELEARFAKRTSAQDLILRESGVAARLLRIVGLGDKAVDFSAYWENSPGRRQSGRTSPIWADYADYLADVWVKYLNTIARGGLTPREKEEIRRVLQQPPDKRPGLADAPAVIHKWLDSKLQDIPVLAPTLVTVSNTKANLEGLPARTPNKERMEAFKAEWAKIFDPATVAKLAPLALPDGSSADSNALSSHDSEIKRLRDLKNRLPAATNQLETFQLLWFPENQPTSFTLAEFRNN
jgi:hypothetical protein